MTFHSEYIVISSTTAKECCCSNGRELLGDMAVNSERCSPYKLALGLLIGYFIGKEDDGDQVDRNDPWVKRQGHGPTPYHLRVLSSVISDQLKAVEHAEEKSLGQLQREIRDGFSSSEYGVALAERLGRRLSAVRYPDDLVNLVTWLRDLLEEPQDPLHGLMVRDPHFRYRPLNLQPCSLFGVFLRRLALGCHGGSFRRLSLLYEEVVRFVGGTVQEPEESSEDDVSLNSDIEMDLDSPTPQGSIAGGGGFGGATGADVEEDQDGFRGTIRSTGHIDAFLKQQRLQKRQTTEAQSSALQHSTNSTGIPDDARAGVEAWADGQGDEVGSSVAGVEGGGDVKGFSLSHPTVMPAAAWQLRLHLQNTVLRLEKGLSSRVPFEIVEGEVQAALSAHSDMPTAHFLRLVNCIHHRELQCSLDSLHRYFDYAVRRGGPSAATAEGFPDIAKGIQGGSGRHNPQHASLALASLHFQFGHLELASVALDEAIRVAQQSGDKVCVAQALGWLYQVLAAQGHPRAGDVLRRCASQAVELGLTSLATATALLLAKEAAVARNGSYVATGSSSPNLAGNYGATTGGLGSSGSSSNSSSAAAGYPASAAASRQGWDGRVASPMRIWDCLTAASCGNVRGLLETEAGGGSNGLDDLPPPPPGGGGGGVSGGRGFIETPGGTGGEGAGALACQRLLVEAGAFERFGYSEMAVACARSVLQVHVEVASASDVEMATACIINAILRGKRLSGPGLSPRITGDVSGGAGGQQERSQQKGRVRSSTGKSAAAMAEARSPNDSMLDRGGDRGYSELDEDAVAWRNNGIDVEGDSFSRYHDTENECVYEEALALALRQYDAFPHPVSNIWAGTVMVLLHEWMVNRGEFTAAEGLGMSLRGCCPLNRGVEAFIEAHLQRVRLLRAQSRWHEAINAASALAKLSDARGLAPQYARLLLELSRARLGAEPSSPVGALPHVLRCLAVCESYTLDAIHASAMTHLAEVHLRMGSTRRARILLRACLGHLLANSSVQTQGEAWVSMAKCEIAEFSLIVGRRGHDGVLGDQAKEATGQERRGEHADEDSGARCDDDKMMAESLERRKAPKASCGLRRAVECLDRAVEQLKRCHDFAGLRECWCLKARVCGELVVQGGDFAEEARRERDTAAEAFLAMVKAGVRAQATPVLGLKIGPAEILKYTATATSNVPWVS